ncbi:MAG: methylmalonyl Co-A mutase-associated GTPase MeaB [Chloroflexi bacterium]|nr:MAG: methylmalonyl Co-A mutase-associated GTPase MeaB [Chloroflexota bacterium]
MASKPLQKLTESLLQGNRRALSRLLSYVENEREGVDDVLAALFPHTGKAWIIGITGAPGTGKSSLVNTLAKAYRAHGTTVGIIAVDPTSPFSGGAILGDRIRMRDLSGDAGVFIRSMATRGSLGGLARATRDAIRVLDAAGFDLVLVETVGAGQSEVDIVRTAHTTVLVEAPGLGDDVQAIKAGILEIADILVVNKADRPGVKKTVAALKAMLELGHPASLGQLVAHHGRLLPVEDKANGRNAETPMWIPPIVQTIALETTGIDDLMTVIEAHRNHLVDAKIFAQIERQQIEIELHDRLRETLMRRFLQDIDDAILADVIAQIQARRLAPQTAIEQLLRHM